MDAKNILGIDMANIKTISTVDVPQDWEVVYEVDFTDNTSGGALNTDGIVELWGPHAVDWVCKYGSNTSYVNRVEVVNGTGLQFEFFEGNTQSHLYQNQNTAPRLMALASDIIPGLTADDVIEFQMLGTSSGLDANYQFIGLQMNDGDMSNSGEWIHNSMVFVTSDARDCLRQGNGTMVHTTLIGTSALLEPEFRGLRWNAGLCGFAGTSKFTDKFIPPATTTDFNATGVGAATCTTVSPASPVINITNGYIGLHGFFATPGAIPLPAAGTPWTATITKFRALKRSN